MRLVQIEITNFLSIAGTMKLDLDKSVTILLGSNDHGKTNVLKAIEHLNDDRPITAEETNWDAEGVPSISFTLLLSPNEQSRWKAIVEPIAKRRKKPITLVAADQSTQGEPDAASTKPSPTSTAPPKPVPAGDTSALAEEDDEGWAALGLSDSFLDAARTTLILSRDGVDGELKWEGIHLDDLPDALDVFLADQTPRVELFQALTGNLQDSATAKTIATEEYEFLQGVFFYADLTQ